MLQPAITTVLLLAIALAVTFYVTERPSGRHRHDGRCWHCNRRLRVDQAATALADHPVYERCDHGGSVLVPLTDTVCVRCECIIRAGDPAYYTLEGDPIHAPECPVKVRQPA